MTIDSDLPTAAIDQVSSMLMLGDDQTKVRGVPVTEELYDLILFTAIRLFDPSFPNSML
jgi:hypothetical protein